MKTLIEFYKKIGRRDKAENILVYNYESKKLKHGNDHEETKEAKKILDEFRGVKVVDGGCACIIM